MVSRGVPLLVLLAGNVVAFPECLPEPADGADRTGRLMQRRVRPGR